MISTPVMRKERYEKRLNPSGRGSKRSRFHGFFSTTVVGGLALIRGQRYRSGISLAQKLTLADYRIAFRAIIRLSPKTINPGSVTKNDLS